MPMGSMRTVVVSLGTLVPALLGASFACAHGFAGKRFFPATLATEDSFVAPELDFLYANARAPGAEGGDVTAQSLSAELAKPLTRRFQLSVAGSYRHLGPQHGPTESGFDNVEVGAKYQVFIDGDAESALAVGVDAELGGSGSKRVDAESSSTFAPGVFYSKGFGNLAVPALRPAALTVQIAPAFSTDGNAPHTVDWGLSLQYSLPYLESFVKDTGLGGPWRNMIPLIEIPMETCLDRGCSGDTSGTVNPGVVWVGRYSQIGVELTVPVNHDSGSRVGFLLQYHLYLDDIVPSWSVR